MRYGKASGLVAAGVAAAVLVMACGGGDGNGSGSSSASTLRHSLEKVEGDVIAGGSAGGLVFLDLNANLRLDPGEPKTDYSADGTFVLWTGVRTSADLAAALIVAQAEDGTKLETPAAVLIDLPADARITLSPLTSLVAAEVTKNSLTPKEASQHVQEALALGDRDPLSNYMKSGDAVLKTAADSVAHVAAEQPKTSQTSTSQRFVVQLKDGGEDPSQVAGVVAGLHQGVVGATYRYALRGFAITVPTSQVDAFLATLAARPDVELVESDVQVVASEVVQSNPSWGLDRIDQRALPLDAKFTYVATGTTVLAYVVDSGVRSTHRDFATRVAQGFSAIADGHGTDDCNGHGTHVAGIVAGMTSGVAKGATVVPVRVLGCNGVGNLSGVLSGLDWIRANYGGMPSVVNMSVKSSASTIMDGTVTRLVAARITVVAAAGNGNASACNVSPARASAAITVAATDSLDRRAQYSNYGTCVDILAPGSAIISAGNATDTAYVEMTGTSMAAPHVAGVVATFLQANPAGTPEEAASAVVAAATVGRVANLGPGTPDALLFTDLGAASLPPSGPISSPISTPISAPSVWPPVVPVVYAGALTGYSTAQGNSWRTTVTVTVAGSWGALVPGAEVAGTFTVGGSAKCVTGTNGSCTLVGGNLSPKTTQTTFTIRSVYLPGIAYEAGRNVVNSVVVNKP